VVQGSRIDGRPASRRLKLTEQVVAKIAPGERVYDTGVPGFFALGLKEGVSFRVLADIPAAARRWGMPKRTVERAVGRWSPNKRTGNLTPKAARTIADSFVAAIKKGEDPAPRAAAVPVTGWTIEQAWRAYRDGYLVKEGVSDKTIRTYEFNFKRLPEKWHPRPIREMIIDVAGLQKLHDAIRAGVIAKTNKTSLKPTTGMNSADSTINFLSILAGYARGKDPTLPAWIARAVDRHGKRSRETDAMGLAHLQVWWSNILTLRNPIKRELSLFMLLTGLRSQDARTIRWEHLNEQERTLFVPSPKGHRRDKPGRSRAFTLPLTDAMLACIDRSRASWTKAKPKQPSPYLFPSDRGPSGYFTSALVERNGKLFLKGHALRHTFATIGEDIGIAEETIGRLLNHKPKTITGRYADPTKTPASRRDAMEQIAAAIMREIKI
jgi:integrase